jgi:hypothetical protein
LPKTRRERWDSREETSHIGPLHSIVPSRCPPFDVVESCLNEMRRTGSHNGGSGCADAVREG